ncbi:putative gustatory receptor 2a [Contarinia nasturtii]|uniref:putative gustatory receptor 2a n=1 Tax=Contarinia nasturtii TaxID=265458 RepID=UPI0012D40FCC|nr:putative gustatory receptor 2a [Contarinia nasturtii]
MYPSSTSYNPQAFKLFWIPFVRFFQLLCVSNYSVFYSTQRVGRLIYFLTFSTLRIALLIYTLFSGLHIQMRPDGQHKYSRLMFYVNFVSLLGNILTQACAHLEPLFTRKHEEEIYRKLNEINQCFATKLNYVTNFEIIRKKYIWHTMTFFIISSGVSFSYSFYSLPGNDFDKFIFLLNRALAVIIIRVRRCQLAFHINGLNNILFDLNFLLKRQQQNYRRNVIGSSSHSSEQIRYLRDIYSNIWIIKNLLSSCFGWTLLTFLVEFSLDLINSSYWAYINIKIYESRNMIIQIVCFIISITVNFWYFCMISERCQNTGASVSNALHTPSNYFDRDYQRFIRIFSLQIRKQPIEIKMKQMFTFNHALMKSTIVLITTYVAIVIQFQISEENVPAHLKTSK